MPHRRKEEEEMEEKREMIMELAMANNAFGIDLLMQLTEDSSEDNIIFSPLSITLALAMVGLGAKKKTRKQINEVLHFDEVEDCVFLLLKELQTDLNSENDAYILEIANKLYGQMGYKFRKSFLAKLGDVFDSTLEEVDFVEETEKSRKQINEWVESQTNNKITKLIPRGALTSDSRLVIVNAVYFKGDWKFQFKKTNTKKEPFYVDSDTTVSVDMMTQIEKVKFGYNKELKTKVLELPYEGDKLSMIILLPDHSRGLQDLEERLTPDILSNLKAIFKIRRRETLVKIPKFKLKASFKLEDTLSLMGVKNAFNPALADLSGISKDGGLHLSSVIHKAYIEVNEEGSEAAAATGAIIALTSMPMEPKKFVADHPFLFLIMDYESGAVLFMGRMMRPAGGKGYESNKPPRNESTPIVEENEYGDAIIEQEPQVVNDNVDDVATLETEPEVVNDKVYEDAMFEPEPEVPVIVNDPPKLPAISEEDGRHVTSLWVDTSTFYNPKNPHLFLQNANC